MTSEEFDEVAELYDAVCNAFEDEENSEYDALYEAYIIKRLNQTRFEQALSYGFISKAGTVNGDTVYTYSDVSRLREIEKDVDGYLEREANSDDTDNLPHGAKANEFDTPTLDPDLQLYGEDDGQ